MWVVSRFVGFVALRRRNLSSGQRAALAIDLHEAQVREQARLRMLGGKKVENVQQVKNPGTEGAQGSTEPQPADQPKPQKGRTAAKGITTMNTLTNHQRQIIKE